MTKKNELDDLANIFKVLGFRKRLEILEMLNNTGPLTVGEISIRGGWPVKTVSRNLSDLNKAGFVTYRNRGSFIYYRVRKVRLSLRNEMLLFLVIHSFNREIEDKDSRVVTDVMLGNLSSLFRKYLH
ncbi:MAG: metalloregulator ArsR/SmtB family transcription factor [Actinomycetota bacterium]